MSRIIVHSDLGYRTLIKIREHTVIADETIDDGGTNDGPTPMEILLGSVGGCIVVTARAYAQRKGWPLTGVSVELEMDRFNGSEYPGYTGEAKFVHEVREHVTFEGDLTDEQRARLLEIAGRCPVHRVLENPVFFKRLGEKLSTGV
jgi:putative redox protein